MRTRWRPRRDRSAGPPRCTARGGVQKWAYPGFVDSGAEPGPGPWGGVRLTHPVAQRLMGDAEVLRHTLDRLAARPRQTHRPRPEFARVSGHRPRHADHPPSAGVFQPRTVRITGIASHTPAGSQWYHPLHDLLPPRAGAPVVGVPDAGRGVRGPGSRCDGRRLRQGGAHMNGSPPCRLPPATANEHQTMGTEGGKGIA